MGERYSYAVVPSAVTQYLNGKQFSFSKISAGQVDKFLPKKNGGSPALLQTPQNSSPTTSLPHRNIHGHINRNDLKAVRGPSSLTRDKQGPAFQTAISVAEKTPTMSICSHLYRPNQSQLTEHQLNRCAAMESSSISCELYTSSTSSMKQDQTSKSNSQRKSRKRKTKKETTKLISKAYECKVTFLAGHGIGEEKASFVLISDERFSNICNCWNANFPLLHIERRNCSVKEMKKKVTKALQDVLQSKNILKEERLVVVIAAGTNNILQGFNDAKKILKSLINLKDAVQQALPPGAITVLLPLPGVIKKHLSKSTDNKIFHDVNNKIINHYMPLISNPIKNWLSNCRLDGFGIIMKKVEVRKFLRPLENYFMHFSDMSVCSLCLTVSSRLTESYTKGSYCMICDKCLHCFSYEKKAGSSKGKGLQCHNSPCEVELKDLDEESIQQIQNDLKEKAKTTASLSDALAVLLVIAFDKELYILYLKVLKEEEDGRCRLSTCTYNEIALLGMTGLHAVNALKFMPEDQVDFMRGVILIIQDTLQLLSDEGVCA